MNQAAPVALLCAALAMFVANNDTQGPTEALLDECVSSKSVDVCAKSVNQYYGQYKQYAAAHDAKDTCQVLLYAAGTYLELADITYGTDQETADKDITLGAALINEVRTSCDTPYTNKVAQIDKAVNGFKKGDVDITVQVINIIEGNQVQQS